MEKSSNGTSGDGIIGLICKNPTPRIQQKKYLVKQAKLGKATVGSLWAPKICLRGWPEEAPWINQGKEQQLVQERQPESQGLNPSET